MKTIASLLMAPTLAAAGALSGSILDLANKPLAGVRILSSTSSTTTSSGGAWSLVSSGIHRARTVEPSRLRSHLILENHRLRIEWTGRTVSGQKGTSAPSQVDSNHWVARETSAATADTLQVFWKGKRLVTLPVSGSDSSLIVLRIDTAWSDDAKIPWNPLTPYGSVKDTRDGRTYRTVAIGSQTWMAENLNFPVDSSRWYLGIDFGPDIDVQFNDSLTLGAKYGSLYTWTASMGVADSCGKQRCVTPDTCLGLDKFCALADMPRTRGVCPARWHVPIDSEWSLLAHMVEQNPLSGPGNAGVALKSTSGWSRLDTATRLDLFGFRALGSGNCFKDGVCYSGGGFGTWWSARESFPAAAFTAEVGSAHGRLDLQSHKKTTRYAVRCVMD
ncbi:MAG: hypothetical protein IPN71_00105 [Fibrobacteres bacterium]|jgi:uncharacterized protein (TIGR02145 family)|nr:hypothetical protein [Fibrobacterota bacterium]